MKQFVLLGEGRTRQVWRRGNYVVKIPINDAGIADNYHEARIYRRSRSEKMWCRYARCRLAGTLLVMEYAAYPGTHSQPLQHDLTVHYIPGDKLPLLPEWVLSVDCFQVGYNRAGEIVAYDYGIS